MDNIKLLLEDYKRRLITIKSQKGLDAIADTMLRTKASCYRSFISELERALISENIEITGNSNITTIKFVDVENVSE